MFVDAVSCCFTVSGRSCILLLIQWEHKIELVYQILTSLYQQHLYFYFFSL